MLYVPETLENLRRGGRISLISAALGDILKIKPVLQFKEGVLSCAKKVLGSAMAIAAVLDRIPKAAVRKIGVLKVSACQQFERLKEKIRAKFPNIPLLSRTSANFLKRMPHRVILQLSLLNCSGSGKYSLKQSYQIKKK